MSKGSDDLGKALGFVIFFILVLIAVIPKEVWIALGVVTVAALVIWGIVRAVDAYDKRRAEAEEQARVERAAKAAAAKREREEQARKEKQHRIETLGKENAALVESSLAAVTHLSAMLYGIEATPEATPTDSAADAVMARVQAYREIKNQIQQARDA